MALGLCMSLAGSTSGTTWCTQPKQIQKFALADQPVAKLFFPLRNDNEAEVAFFWDLYLQLCPKGRDGFTQMARQWNTILHAQLSNPKFGSVYPKSGRQLQEFHKQVASSFRIRDSLKVSAMLQVGSALHQTPLPTLPVGSALSSAATQMGPPSPRSHPLSQAAQLFPSDASIAAQPQAHVASPPQSGPPQSGPPQASAPSPNPVDRKRAKTAPMQSTLWPTLASANAGTPAQAGVSATSSSSASVAKGCISCHLWTWFQACKQHRAFGGVGRVDPNDIAKVPIKGGHVCPHPDVHDKVFKNKQGAQTDGFEGWTGKHWTLYDMWKKRKEYKEYLLKKSDGSGWVKQ